MDRFYNADIDIFLHKAFMNLAYEQYQYKSRNNNKKTVKHDCLLKFGKYYIFNLWDIIKE